MNLTSQKALCRSNSLVYERKHNSAAMNGLSKTEKCSLLFQSSSQKALSSSASLSLKVLSFGFAKSTCSPDSESNLPIPWQPKPGTLEKGDTRATFFYLNDLHSWTDSMPYIKEFSDKFDKNYKDITTFKVAGGDMKVGQGKNFNNAAIDFMNSIGLEFSAIGNHELDCGIAQFARQLPKMKTKFIASNVKIESPKLTPFFNPFEKFNEKLQPKNFVNKPKKLFSSCAVEKNGETYGFVGAATYTNTYRKSLEGFRIQGHNGSIRRIQSEIDKLKQKGINKIIMLSHMGTKVDTLIVPELDGVDIVIEGHDHKFPEKPIELKSKSKEPVLMVQAGSIGEYCGILDVVFDSKGIIKNQSKYNNLLFKTKDNFIDSDVISKIWDKHFPRNQKIAELKEDFVPKQLKTRENPMANLFAESLLAMDHKNSGHRKPADLALMLNVGKIRKTNLPKGEITNRDIIKYNVWGDRIYKTNLTGAKILEILQYGADTVKARGTNKKRLIHSSNLLYTFDFKNKKSTKNKKDVKIIDPKKIVNHKPIEEKDCKPINPKEEYIVVFDDLFLQEIGKDISLAPNGESPQRFREVLRQTEKSGPVEGYEKTSVCKWDKSDAVINYIEELDKIPAKDGKTLLERKLLDNKRLRIAIDKDKD